MKRIFRHIATLAVAAAAAACVSEKPTPFAESSLVGVGDKAPAFSTTLVDGSVVSLADYAGEPVLLILFDCACPDCKALLDELHAELAAGTPTPPVLAVARDCDRATVEAYRAEHGYTVAMAPDPERAVYGLYATSYVPRAYIIGSDGYIERMTTSDKSSIKDVL